MGQQVRPVGPGIAALGGRLEAVEQAGIGEILGEKSGQLRLAEGLQVLAQAEADHLPVIAGDRRQQAVEFAAVGVATVQQAPNHGIHDLHDLVGAPALEAGPGAGADGGGEAPDLCLAQHRHLNLNRRLGAIEGEGLPADLALVEARQVARAFNFPHPF